MSTLPRIESVLGHIPCWLQRRSDIAGSVLAELACLGCGELEHMVPVSAAPVAHELLRRMAALHLDASELSRTEPETFQDLQVCCALCESRDECTRDLVKESSGLGEQDWRDYCPNAGTFNMLVTLESY